MNPEFIKLRGEDKKEYLFRVDKIHFAEDTEYGCDIWHEFDTNDVRWYSVKEKVADVAKKLNNIGENKIKVG